ncbi:MAG: NADH-quinone oxidoreductase subunit L [marine bacterium B5-7]|nr:MAG: NADH-quinone oxidoreductase subunit L [marine bacterium B5-7]
MITMTILHMSLLIALLPLMGSMIAGFFGQRLGRMMTHRITIGLMWMSFALALFVLKFVIVDGAHVNATIYQWVASGKITFAVGFLIDHLSAWMMVIVTFVSTLVHIYSIGYMHDDEGYQRFFSYISLFTFMMLMLVTANNFMQLFFGWEGVGLVSYLLIGFWFKKPTAILGSMKAFLVNRVGDFGFLLGIAAVLYYFGTLDYSLVFAKLPMLAKTAPTISLLPGTSWSIFTVMGLCMFVGAMGKSAQIPLHVWLPESMEGPTPISALIHAATMVTAGIYMVSRLSPIFELSTTALSVILVIGATGALFLGILGIFQHDIKRVVAYSTLSQLGYMTAALGASAFSAAMFHMMMHACFKALLFLGAGSVIIAMHHEQDMRKMGGLRHAMPITYITFLIGGLSLSAIPPFSGFYSKDAIIEAVGLTQIPGASYAYACVLIGAFVTAVYTFRAFFLTFHGKPRMDKHTQDHLKESPWVVTLPLVLLAIPSVIAGLFTVKSALYSTPGGYGHALFMLPHLNVMKEMALDYHGWLASALHAVSTVPFWLAMAGIATAYYFTLILSVERRERLLQRMGWLGMAIDHKFGFDDFNEKVIVRASKGLANTFFKVGDRFVIETLVINGSAKLTQCAASIMRRCQSGYLTHYAFVMVVGLMALVAWMVFGAPHVDVLQWFSANY